VIGWIANRARGLCENVTRGSPRVEVNGGMHHAYLELSAR